MITVLDHPTWGPEEPTDTDDHCGVGSGDAQPEPHGQGPVWTPASPEHRGAATAGDRAPRHLHALAAVPEARRGRHRWVREGRTRTRTATRTRTRPRSPHGAPGPRPPVTRRGGQRARGRHVSARAGHDLLWANGGAGGRARAQLPQHPQHPPLHPRAASATAKRGCPCGRRAVLAAGGLPRDVVLPRGGDPAGEGVSGVSCLRKGVSWLRRLPCRGQFPCRVMCSWRRGEQRLRHRSHDCPRVHPSCRPPPCPVSSPGAPGGTCPRWGRAPPAPRELRSRSRWSRSRWSRAQSAAGRTWLGS